MLVDRYIKNNKITCNIYGTNGELLIGVGTPINDNIKKRLSERKWHLDKPSNYIYDNIALLDDDLVPIINENGVNTKLIRKKAQKIVDIILNNPIIFSNLKRTRRYDEYTYVHCNQVAYLSVAMGIRLGLSNRELINIAIAALTHDIGKCLINKNIINKPGKLTDEEMNLVRQHPMHGYNIMKENTDIDENVLKAILFHHENFDGTGYPFGLVDEEIPIEASIIHVCDVFDALVSERPYKKKLNEYDSINILKKDSGMMFDPKMIDIFCSSMQIYKIGSIVEIANGTKIEITNIIKDKFDNVIEIEFKEWIPPKILTKAI